MSVDASVIEGVFRAESGRAVASLVRFFGDIDIAEEAVQDAFEVALQRWPEHGLPPSPAGWIITTAKNRAIDRLRRESTRDGEVLTVELPLTFVEAATPVTGLSHIAIATPAADPLAEALVASLGATRGEEELIDGGALRVVFVHLGPVTFELLEPRDPAHTVAKFLEKRGPGLHHVSLDVAGIESALAGCAAAGIQLIDRAPRPGATTAAE